MHLWTLGILIVGVGLFPAHIEAATPNSSPTRPSALPKTDQLGDPLPNGAVARLGTIRFRPGGHGASAVSPDGKWLATDLISKTRTEVVLWDSKTGQAKWRYKFDDASWIRSLHFRTDSRQLAVVARNQVFGEGGFYSLGHLPSRCGIRS